MGQPKPQSYEEIFQPEEHPPGPNLMRLIIAISVFSSIAVFGMATVYVFYRVLDFVERCVG